MVNGGMVIFPFRSWGFGNAFEVLLLSANFPAHVTACDDWLSTRG